MSAVNDPISVAEAIFILGCSRSTYYRRADIPKILVDGQVCTPKSALYKVKFRGGRGANELLLLTRWAKSPNFRRIATRFKAEPRP